MASFCWFSAWYATSWFEWAKATAALPSVSMLDSGDSLSRACTSAGTHAFALRISSHIANHSVASSAVKPSFSSSV